MVLPIRTFTYDRQRDPTLGALADTFERLPLRQAEPGFAALARIIVLVRIWRVWKPEYF